MTTLEIYRSGTPPTLQASVNIDERTVFQKKLMGEHRIVSEFYSSSILPIQISDYIVYNTESFYINRLPDIEKINNSTFKYNIVFESVLYDLNKKLFISTDGLADFSYNGTANDFITSIVANLNVTGSGWTVGTVDTSTEQTLQFTNEYCMAALIRVAEAFKMEYSLTGKSISLLNSVGSTTTYSFQYGRGLGLYKLTRQQVNDQNILTKVYGFGGTKNIPSTYRSRAKRLTFAVAGQAASGFLVSSASGLYGTIEGQYTDENIYPQRTSTLTGASGIYDEDNLFDFKNSYVEDSALDFDINNYLIEGLTAKIVFKSGDLSGVECEIWKYDNSAKRIYYNPYSDTDGYTLPYYNGGSPVQPEIGDSYTLVDMSLPQSYIDTAEADLLEVTQDYLTENSVPQVVYSVDIDPKYASSISLDLDAGDKVTIVDTDLSINSLIRVSGIEFPLVDPYRIKAVIADFIPYTLQERLIKGTKNNRVETVFVDRRNSETARRNTMRQKQIKDLLFDTDGYFDPVNIKPLSIETAYLAVGTKSRDFWLSNVTIKANYEGDANALYVSAGSLVHLQIQISGLGYTWVIGSAFDQDSLTPATAYYLYAKCSKTALTGQWILSSSQITLEQVDGYYHFLVGMLFAVADGYRDFDFVAGMTYISGNTITTGKIQSIDGNNYFDLTNNKFHIGNASGYVDWNAASGVLGVKGSIIITGGNGYSNLTDRPTSVSGINSTEGAKLTSVASGATVGATWGTNLNSIPSRLAETAPDNSLAFTDDFLGFHASGTSWPVKISNVSGVGKFYAGDGGNNYMDWNGTTLSIKGVLSGVDSNLATVAVPEGDLAGSVANTVANTPAIYTLTLTGSSGEINIICNGISHPATFVSTLAAAAATFVANYSNSFPGVTVTNPSGADITFTGGVQTLTIGEVSGDLNASGGIVQSPVKRKDTVTLTGTSGTANVLCDGVTSLASFVNSLADTAEAFKLLYAADYLAGGVVVTNSGNDIVFEAEIAGVDFTGSTTITNIANTYRGNIKIEGNEIWENTQDNDTYGFITINRKGYNGGNTRPRYIIIGNGLGRYLAQFGGIPGTNYPHGFIKLYAELLELENIPTSSAGLAAGYVYRDGNTLKIV